jgi:hypothetical protein
MDDAAQDLFDMIKSGLEASNQCTSDSLLWSLYGARVGLGEARRRLAVLVTWAESEGDPRAQGYREAAEALKILYNEGIWKMGTNSPRSGGIWTMKVDQ